MHTYTSYINPPHHPRPACPTPSLLWARRHWSPCAIPRVITTTWAASHSPQSTLPFVPSTLRYCIPHAFLNIHTTPCTLKTTTAGTPIKNPAAARIADHASP
ncbi:hypothetical protein BCR44DRAFT_1441964 [Catenaria anguillulae PL171]|uniref:Uncharacterized protein n=1 Tax=Catenaria anguillulae PL171 TaxID=765915 RepID=A0A1Y2HCW1_9FUNG|nr:hypothetical protein BCR44DRAFT_1441964 [Catenaria anguillulae PL171]